MKFYGIDEALKEAVISGDKPLRVKIEIETNGHFESVCEQDIIEAHFCGLKETAGGTTARGELLLDNSQGVYSYTNVGAGSLIKVSFSLGEGLSFFHRFNLYINDKGIQDIRGAGRKRCVFIGLLDFSSKLKKTDEAKDWMSPAVFTYSVVCDKAQPEKSLVHGIAQRAGLSVSDVDCSTIPVTLPYVRLRKNTWSELSSLATAYRCHLECPVEKPLVFAHSPYQNEPTIENEYYHTFTGEDIFLCRKTSRDDLYKNTIRLKVNMPITLERQEIWRYNESPVFYNDKLRSYYPFRDSYLREIEMGKFTWDYSIKYPSGKTKKVFYADDIDTKEEAEERLEYRADSHYRTFPDNSYNVDDFFNDDDTREEYIEGRFFYSLYDTETNPDSVTLTLKRTSEGDLYRASIFGRPIIIDQNRACFLRDYEAVKEKGTFALNVTSQYFSEYKVEENLMQYEDWVNRELKERTKKQNEITIKTHKAFVNARVGAKIKIKLKNEELAGTINAFSFRYKKDRAFVASFRITEE